ncbi:MAG: NTP transferase domain-containing protein [Clostridiaceae bacterium]|nr:NTP transferase domain-containing protein [Clostridiaceae bacterium]
MGKIYAIILGGGEGKRLQSSIPKQFIEIQGKTVIEHTIEKFNKNRYIDSIIVVMNKIYNVVELRKKL